MAATGGGVKGNTSPLEMQKNHRREMKRNEGKLREKRMGEEEEEQKESLKCD